MTDMDSAKAAAEAAKPDAGAKLGEASRQRSVSTFGTAMGGLWGKALSGIRSVVSSETEGGATRAKLGTDNTFYYDEKLKRWVDKSDPSSADGPKEIAPPPIKPRDSVTGAPMMGAPNGVGGGSGGPSTGPGPSPVPPQVAVNAQTGMSTGLPPPRRRPGMSMTSPSPGAPTAGKGTPFMMMPGQGMPAGAVPMMPMMPTPGGATPMMPGVPAGAGAAPPAAEPPLGNCRSVFGHCPKLKTKYIM